MRNRFQLRHFTCEIHIAEGGDLTCRYAAGSIKSKPRHEQRRPGA